MGHTLRALTTALAIFAVTLASFQAAASARVLCVGAGGHVKFESAAGNFTGGNALHLRGHHQGTSNDISTAVQGTIEFTNDNSSPLVGFDIALQSNPAVMKIGSKGQKKTEPNRTPIDTQFVGSLYKLSPPRITHWRKFYRSSRIFLGKTSYRSFERLLL